MLLLEPNETPYDLRWRMFGIPVRVHPMFWLISLLMGWSAIRMGVEYVLLWVGCVFVSILIHELGHVWMGQAFGSYGHIVLYGFGGLAIGSNRLASRWQRIAVGFAGPLAGFVFLGVLLVFLWVWDPDLFELYITWSKMSLDLPIEDAEIERLRHGLLHVNRLVFVGVSDLIFINLMWGLMNLLPIWPLDGGQISRDVCEGIWPVEGLTRSLGISLVLAGLLALHCFLVVLGRQLFPLRFGSVYTALLFAVLALQSFQLLQQAHAQRRWMEDHWEE